MISAALKTSLDDLHARYNRRAMIHPDPLEFLWDYPDPRDREIVALVASSLAYGRVAQILKSVRGVLDRMGAPARFLKRSSESALLRTFGGFRHRFTTGEEMAALLYRREAGVRSARIAAGLFRGGARRFRRDGPRRAFRIRRAAFRAVRRRVRQPAGLAG